MPNGVREPVFGAADRGPVTRTQHAVRRLRRVLRVDSRSRLVPTTSGYRDRRADDRQLGRPAPAPGRRPPPWPREHHLLTGPFAASRRSPVFLSAAGSSGDSGRVPIAAALRVRFCLAKRSRLAVMDRLRRTRATANRRDLATPTSRSMSSFALGRGRRSSSKNLRTPEQHRRRRGARRRGDHRRDLLPLGAPSGREALHPPQHRGLASRSA